MNSLNLSIISENIKIKDLSKELEMSVDRSNRILERYLLHRMKTKGLICGKSSGQDIVFWMNQEKIIPPNGCKSLIKWLNYQIYSAIRNGVKDFQIKEIEGSRLGINFVWWFECKELEQQ